MNPQRRREMFERLRALNPHPTTELEYSTPFELLVAVILSAQATDKSVNLATATNRAFTGLAQRLLSVTAVSRATKRFIPGVANSSGSQPLDQTATPTFNRFPGF